LFCHITLNWRGRPLTSHEVIVQTIAATTTSTGLTVCAELDTGTYPTGVTVSDAQMAALPITRHDWHGDWNYTLHPQSSQSSGRTSDCAPLPPAAQDAATLADPALTGMSHAELAALTDALGALHTDHADAHHRQHQHHRAQNGLRPHAPRSGRPPRLPFADQVLATILHKRLSLPYDTLAIWCGCGRSTMHRILHRTGHLLDQHGTVITPVTLPGPLTDTLATIKSAC
jgi:DDE family transposase/DDE superfamily endonuclease